MDTNKHKLDCFKAWFVTTVNSNGRALLPSDPRLREGMACPSAQPFEFGCCAVFALKREEREEKYFDTNLR
jgi:hypothetical protein